MQPIVEDDTYNLVPQKAGMYKYTYVNTCIHAMHPWLSGYTAQWSIDEPFRGVMIPKKVLYLSNTIGQGDYRV